MNSQPGCASTDTHHKLDGTRQSASISLSCCCRFVSAGDGAIPGGGSVGTSGAGGAGEGGAVAAPSNCVKEGAVGSSTLLHYISFEIWVVKYSTGW